MHHTLELTLTALSLGFSWVLHLVLGKQSPTSEPAMAYPLPPCSPQGTGTEAGSNQAAPPNSNAAAVAESRSLLELAPPILTVFSKCRPLVS
mmetsp:Transcript_5006/g.14643  ORF Transcript_5006/g.14643 Transcript_5006/m.14643 type:complete len:92 (-) Transcript_5006:145-420(-)